WTYRGGALQLGFCLRWLLEDLAVAEGDAAGDAAPARVAGADLETAYRKPWSILRCLDRVAPYAREWFVHAAFDEYWRALGARHQFARVSAPALVIGGWYDTFLNGTLADFTQ